MFLDVPRMLGNVVSTYPRCPCVTLFCPAGVPGKLLMQKISEFLSSLSSSLSSSAAVCDLFLSILVIKLDVTRFSGTQAGEMGGALRSLIGGVALNAIGAFYPIIVAMLYNAVAGGQCTVLHSSSFSSGEILTLLKLVGVLSLSFVGTGFLSEALEVAWMP